MAFKAILVLSVKGGTGKSVLSSTLAVKLSEKHKVGLLDEDVDSSNIPEVLGLTGKKIELDKERKFIPIKYNKNLQVFSMSFLLDDIKRSILKTGEEFEQIILDSVANSVWDKDIEYFICDQPAGSSNPFKITRKIFGKNIVGAIIVAQPGVSVDTYRTIDLCANNGIRVLGIVENMSHFKCEKCKKIHYPFGKGDTKKIAEEYGISFLGVVPLQQKIRDKVRKGDLAVVENIVKKLVKKSE